MGRGTLRVSGSGTISCGEMGRGRLDSCWLDEYLGGRGERDWDVVFFEKRVGRTGGARV